MKHAFIVFGRIAFIASGLRSKKTKQGIFRRSLNKKLQNKIATLGREAIKSKSFARLAFFLLRLPP
jgi:hypothetical protein